MGRNKVNDHMYLCISSVKNDISIFHSLFFMFVYRNSVDLLLTDHKSQRTHTLVLWASNAKFLWTGRIHIALYSVHQPQKMSWAEYAWKYHAKKNSRQNVNKMFGVQLNIKDSFS